MNYEKTRQEQGMQMDSVGGSFARPLDRLCDGLRGRICRRIDALERQLAEVKQDLSFLDANPIIEAATDLVAKY